MSKEDTRCEWAIKNNKTEEQACCHKDFCECIKESMKKSRKKKAAKKRKNK